VVDPEFGDKKMGSKGNKISYIHKKGIVKGVGVGNRTRGGGGADTTKVENYQSTTMQH
jgi:hypothetical protein